MKSNLIVSIAIAAISSFSLAIGNTASAAAIHFDFLAPGYVQEIYTVPIRVGVGVTSAGMAWSGAGNLMTKNGDQLQEYSPLPSPVLHQGTSVHSVMNTHNVLGLAPNVNALGITNAPGGFIYANTSLGLQRINPTYTSAMTLAGTVGGAYGITTLPNGKIAYAGGSGNQIYVYDPVLTSNTLLFTSATTTVFDDIEANLTGQIALAGIFEKQLLIIDIAGVLLNTISTGLHHPDGIAFVAGVGTEAIMVNNNDGSISRYDFSSGYSSAPVAVDIATTNAGRRAYGDLASCGPDGALYVTQYDMGVRGSDSGFATKWDNGVNNNEASIVRISSSTPGASLCAAAAFSVPEPSTLPITAIGLLSIFAAHRRSRLGR